MDFRNYWMMKLVCCNTPSVRNAATCGFVTRHNIEASTRALPGRDDINKAVDALLKVIKCTCPHHQTT
jgi:hypothetical protein